MLHAARLGSPALCFAQMQSRFTLRDYEPLKFSYICPCARSPGSLAVCIKICVNGNVVPHISSIVMQPTPDQLGDLFRLFPASVPPFATVIFCALHDSLLAGKLHLLFEQFRPSDSRPRRFLYQGPVVCGPTLAVRYGQPCLCHIIMHIMCARCTMSMVAAMPSHIK